MTCHLCHDKGYTGYTVTLAKNLELIPCTCPAGQAFKQQSKPREGEEAK